MKNSCLLLGTVTLLLTFIPVKIRAQTVEYDLTIALEEVNITGSPIQAMTVNNTIPGPTLEFVEGDEAIIRIHNTMDVESSIHWHGILLPNREDGVPYLTTPPILPGTSYTYRFPLKQSGTYWYHSHTGLQEQRGVYGAIVIRRPGEKALKRDHVLVLSDWTDEDPHEVLRTLKRGSEYYSFKKGAMQSLHGAIRENALRNVFQRAWSRMPAMDISDVAYDAFLINGRQSSRIDALPGDTVRLRIINAGAAGYFYIQFSGGPMRVIAADGLDVQPVEKDRLLIAIAETYDVEVTMPTQSGTYEFRATAQDGSGRASVFFGRGWEHPAPDIPRPNLYMMHHGDMDSSMSMSPSPARDMGEGAMGTGESRAISAHGAAHPMVMEGVNSVSREKTAPMSVTGHDMGETGPIRSGHMEHGTVEMELATSIPAALAGDSGKVSPGVGAHDGMAMEMEGQTERPMPPYDSLRSPHSTALDPTKPLREITLTLTGDMERYVWSFDDMTLTEADVITITHGENVRITFVNKTMMHHPLHFHGHFFRVVNRHGDYSPLKHTVDISPLSTQVIEFYANEEKDWFLHCHILYHMKAGMARVVSYQGSSPDSDILEVRKWPSNSLRHDKWYGWGSGALLSQMTFGRLTAANTRNTVYADWEHGWDENETTVGLVYSRYFNRFFSAFTGLEITNHDNRGVLGFTGLLPLLFEGTVEVGTDGDWRFALENDLQLTDRIHLFGDGEYDTGTQWEWRAGVGVTATRRLSVIGLYHSEFGIGGGLNLEF